MRELTTQLDTTLKKLRLRVLLDKVVGLTSTSESRLSPKLYDEIARAAGFKDLQFRYRGIVFRRGG